MTDETFPHGCLNRSGFPKKAYATREAAERQFPLFSREYHAYECALHGWHIAHSRSRKVRATSQQERIEEHAEYLKAQRRREFYFSRQRQHLDDDL